MDSLVDAFILSLNDVGKGVEETSEETVQVSELETWFSLQQGT